MMIRMLKDEGGMQAGEEISMPAERAADLIEAGVAEAATDQTEPRPRAVKSQATARPRKKAKRATREVEEATEEPETEER
jgi:hypothetical protein